MQQQSNATTNANVHIKVEYNEEYRRFVVETLSFAHLEKTLRTLLNINPSQPIRILFLDDEKDWVLLTSDDELAHAWELSPTLLRLSVKHDTTVQKSTPVLSCPIVGATEGMAPPFIHPHPFHHQFPGARGGCMKGRGGKGRCDPAMRLQFLDTKIARLTEKHQALKAKMEGMPEDKARCVSWRLAHLENKIENVKWKKEHFAKMAQCFADQSACKTDLKMELETPAEQEQQQPTPCPYGWGGRGRGHCRGRWGNPHCDNGESTESPCPRQQALSNPLFVTFQERKVELKAARRSGNQEEIEAKWEAVQEAKEAWQQAKRAQWACRKQAK
jgi:hypothetical protein